MERRERAVIKTVLLVVLVACFAYAKENDVFARDPVAEEANPTSFTNVSPGSHALRNANALPVVSITSSVSTIAETDISTSVIFTVSRDNIDSSALEVTLSFPGNAVLDTDFSLDKPAVFTDRKITIPADSLSVTFILNPIPNPRSNFGRAFVVRIEDNAVSYTKVEPFFTVLLISDVFLPFITITTSPATTIAESDTGNSVIFTVTRFADIYPDPLDIKLSFSGSAIIETDFSLDDPTIFSNNKFTIPTGQASATFTLTPIQNDNSDNDKTFTVTAEPNITTYAISSPIIRTVTIANDPPTLRISADKTTIPEDSATPATFTVSRLIATSSSLTVSIVLSGSATLTSDFTIGSLSGSGPYSLIIPANQVSATFTVQPVRDQLRGGSEETVTFEIQSGSGYVVMAGDGDEATLFITNVGSAIGDPHMIGFQGQLFDYIGENGQVINMLSDPLLQVNAKLGLQKQSANMYVSGPVMMEMAFMTRSHTISINAGGYEKDQTAFVLVDGVLLPAGQSFLDGILSVTFTALSASSSDVGLGGSDHVVGEVVVRLEGLYEFRVFMIENGRDLKHPDRWFTKYPRRFLDFNASLLDLDRRPHGILGQTAAPLSKDRSMGEWSIEGNDEDYVVKDGLTGTQFSFNKFQ